jgi:hypothetical protein
MQKLESRIGRSVVETAGTSKPGKPQSLRLEKQTIRTLTGEELKLAGGGRITACRPCTSSTTAP